MWRAAKLEAGVYDEVIADEEATGQALGVVVLAALTSSAGQAAGFRAVYIETLLGIVFWYMGAGLTYWLGAKIFPESQVQAEYGGVLRATGFSSAPGVIFVLSIFPDITDLIIMLGLLWSIAAEVIAIRQSLKYRSVLRAFGIRVVSTFVMVMIYQRAASWLGVLPLIE